jgi:hypothetical protein
VGTSRILGLEEKFRTGDMAVYEHTRDSERIILLQIHRSYRTDHLVEDFEKIGISRDQIEWAFEQYQRSRQSR